MLNLLKIIESLNRYIYICFAFSSFLLPFLSNIYIYPIQTYYSRARGKSLFQVNGEVKKPDLAIDPPLPVEDTFDGKKFSRNRGANIEFSRGNFASVLNYYHAWPV